MLSLRAVDPEWRGVVDHDAKYRGLSLGLAGRSRLEAGVEARDVGAVHADGLAGLGEGRLGRGVVATNELELNHIARVGRNLLGLESRTTVTDSDNDHFCAGGLGCWCSVSLACANMSCLITINVPEATPARAARASVENCILK